MVLNDSSINVSISSPGIQQVTTHTQSQVSISIPCDFITRKLHSCNPIHKRGKIIINILQWISGWLHLRFSISSSSVQVANTLQQIVAISYKPVIHKEICSTSSTNYNVTSNLQSKFSHWNTHRRVAEYSPSFD